LPLSNATFRTKEIAAEDVLSAARTLPNSELRTLPWLDHWVPATTFLDWAHRGLKKAASMAGATQLCTRSEPPLTGSMYFSDTITFIPLVNANYDEKAGAREISVSKYRRT
jgi:hypothetical protein